MKPSKELKTKLLSILRDGNAWKDIDLYTSLGGYPGHSLNSIVAALRKDGHNIDCFRSAWATYSYRLLGVANAGKKTL